MKSTKTKGNEEQKVFSGSVPLAFLVNTIWKISHAKMRFIHKFAYFCINLKTK